MEGRGRVVEEFMGVGYQCFWRLRDRVEVMECLGAGGRRGVPGYFDAGPSGPSEGFDNQV